MDTLQQAVNELAARAMLAEDNVEEIGPLLASLAVLSAQAAAAGNLHLSEAALRLSSSSVATGDALRDGLLHLEKILEAPDAMQSTSSAQSSGSSTAPEVDPEMLREFLTESRDHLASIEAQVLTLEQDPANHEAVHAIFRGFHTIKGLAGFLELPAMQKVAHEVETLLDRVRNGSLAVSPGMVDVILAGEDYLKTEVTRVETMLSGAPAGDPAAYSRLLERVRVLLAESGDSARQCEAHPLTSPVEPVSKSPVPQAEARIVKVNTAKLDFLVDMVGELVIAQSMIRHDGELSAVANPQLQRNLARLSRITGEVQKTAMSMRMVPVGQLFQKSVRLVRDLMRRSGKQAEVELEGEDTELDRTIVEDLSDPLVHMIRNSADHGVETPEERERAGKSPVARISLKAYHQAGHIVIEVSDDGRGLHREKLIQKAKERGLIADGTGMTDKEVFNLIFEPGFSTAEQVTDVSGRGVGMDVVRRQLQKMRGRVDIDSTPGKGATFYMRLPLTLAIIDGLVVAVGRERFIVPIFAVREIFRPRKDAIFTVENRDEMIFVRGNLLPVVRLHDRFEVEPRSRDLSECVVVVAEGGGKRFCLAVDELIGKQEVVIKSLGETFKNVTGLAGGAILGDGCVGLILDMEGVYGSRALCG